MIAKIFKTEPALIIGVVVAIVSLLVSFGIPVTEDQSQAIQATIKAILILGGAFVTRQLVTPTAKAEEDAAKAYTEGLYQPVPGSLEG